MIFSIFSYFEVNTMSINRIASLLVLTLFLEVLEGCSTTLAAMNRACSNTSVPEFTKAPTPHDGTIIVYANKKALLPEKKSLECEEKNLQKIEINFTYISDEKVTQQISEVVREASYIAISDISVEQLKNEMKDEVQEHVILLANSEFLGRGMESRILTLDIKVFQQEAKTVSRKKHGKSKPKK